MWGKIDEPLKMFRTSPRGTRMFGHAGPSDRQGDRGLHEVHHHRHVRQGRAGHEAEDAVKWAEGELKKIYET